MKSAGGPQLHGVSRVLVDRYEGLRTYVDKYLSNNQAIHNVMEDARAAMSPADGQRAVEIYARLLEGTARRVLDTAKVWLGTVPLARRAAPASLGLRHFLTPDVLNDVAKMVTRATGAVTAARNPQSLGHLGVALVTAFMVNTEQPDDTRYPHLSAALRAMDVAAGDQIAGVARRLQCDAPPVISSRDLFVAEFGASRTAIIHAVKRTGASGHATAADIVASIMTNLLRRFGAAFRYRVWRTEETLIGAYITALESAAAAATSIITAHAGVVTLLTIASGPDRPL